MNDTGLIGVQEFVVAMDYGQFILCGSADSDGESEMALLREALAGDKVAGESSTVVVVSPHQNNFAMPLRVELWNRKPPSDFYDWEEVCDAPLEVEDGVVRYESPTLTGVSWPMANGRYRVRICGRGFVNRGWPGSTTPGDVWRLQFWPAREDLPPRRFKSYSTTEVDEFWELLDSVSGDSRTAWFDALVMELSRRPVPRIARFQRILMDLCDRALTWDMWSAADIVYHPLGASTDSFVYFRLWLVGQGRATFERAVGCPDSLADNEAIVRFMGGDHSDAAFPELEELMGVAEEAFERVLQKLAPAVAARVDRPDELDLRPREAPWESPAHQTAFHPRLEALVSGG